MTKPITPTELESYRQILRQVLALLTGDIDKLEKEALGPLGDRSADSGSEVDSYAQEFSLELLERDESTVREVLDALERVESGTYGRCELCNAWIRRQRLKAVPHARNCIDCQRAQEGTF